MAKAFPYLSSKGPLCSLDLKEMLTILPVLCQKAKNSGSRARLAELPCKAWRAAVALGHLLLAYLHSTT